MNILEKIQNTISENSKNLELNISPEEVIVEVPDDSSNGQYSTNIAMKLASEKKQSPRDIAQIVAEMFIGDEDFEKVEVAGPGFINFYVSEKYLLKKLSEIVKKGSEYMQLDTKKGKDIVIEFTDPNPFKIFHIGHLYTNTVGESFSRLQEALGASVKRANYQGDVGLHVAKTWWALLEKMKEDEIDFSDLEKRDLVSRIQYLGDAYIYGFQKYDDEKDYQAMQEIDDLNYYFFALFVPSLERRDFSKYEDIDLEEKYKISREWCLDYFETIYKRLDCKFDYYFFESEVGEAGLKVVLDNVGKVFEEDDGAIIYKGDPEKGLHTRVFVSKYGIPTYEAKELGLVYEKASRMKFDESVILTADEQSGYFKVVLDALSKIDPDTANTTKHMAHGMVKLPGKKKMSSRKGQIVTGEDLLDSTKESVKELMIANGRVKESDIDDVSEKIAVAAIKYAFLRVGVGKDVVYDKDESISFDGNTGPYLLYVYARCNSLVNEASFVPDGSVCLESCQNNSYLIDLVEHLGKSNQLVLTSALNYSPSTLCQYLFELGKKFNNFYQNVRVLDASEDEQAVYLNAVYATMTVLKKGLDILGIPVVEEM